MGGLVVEGADTDRAYNALAIRYNALLKLYECVREAISTSTLNICQDKNK